MILVEENNRFSYGCKNESYVERNKLEEYVLKYIASEYCDTIPI